MKNEDIPARIREHRQRLGLTQEQLAQKVGTERFAAGRREGSMEEVATMSEKLLHELPILTGSLSSEPMRVKTVRALPASAGQAGHGPDTWVLERVGTQSERFRKVTLTRSDLESLALRDTRHTHGQTPEVLPPLPKAHPAGIP
ncbi:MAG: hypothetical protein KatS3mg082_2196 [Nitrospiraceae bacterium]|nr:MAG: hypothetical protein KatS3mg082_2196 [Nitrospiraceae bacterium]